MLIEALFLQQLRYINFCNKEKSLSFTSELNEMPQNKDLHIEFKIIQGKDALENDWQKLLDGAEKTAVSAYAPYSKFKVGAGVLLSNKKLVFGSNQENAAYPSGLCAERVAVFAAKAQFPNASLEKIAVTAIDAKGKWSYSISPCGACRQVMLEYENNQGSPFQILFPWEGQFCIAKCMNDLIPLSFSSKTFTG